MTPRTSSLGSVCTYRGNCMGLRAGSCLSYTGLELVWSPQGAWCTLANSQQRIYGKNWQRSKGSLETASELSSILDKYTRPSHPSRVLCTIPQRETLLPGPLASLQSCPPGCHSHDTQQLATSTHLSSDDLQLGRASGHSRPAGSITQCGCEAKTSHATLVSPLMPE